MFRACSLHLLITVAGATVATTAVAIPTFHFSLQNQATLCKVWLPPILGLNCRLGCSWLPFTPCLADAYVSLLQNIPSDFQMVQASSHKKFLLIWLYIDLLEGSCIDEPLAVGYDLCANEILVIVLLEFGKLVLEDLVEVCRCSTESAVRVTVTVTFRLLPLGPTWT